MTSTARYITVFGKFVQLTPNLILETVGLPHSTEGAFLLRYTNFHPIDSFPSEEKFEELFVFISKNVEYRVSTGRQVFYSERSQYN